MSLSARGARHAAVVPTRADRIGQRWRAVFSRTQHKVKSRDGTDPQTLPDLGISTSQSSRWQALGRVLDDEFEVAPEDTYRLDRWRKGEEDPDQ